MREKLPFDVHLFLQTIIKIHLGTMSSILSFPIEKIEENWQNIWEVARQHKLQIVLHQVLNKHAAFKNMSAFSKLQKYRLQQLQRNLLKLKELQKTIRAFEQAGITVTPYKGLPFAQYFYQDISMRSSIDIDLAISLVDIPASFAIMKSLGYIEYSKEKNGASSNQKELHKSRAYHIDYSWLLYDGEKVKMNIELHWQPSHPVLYLPLEFGNLPTSARTSIQISNQEVTTFTKPYLALFTLIHHGLIDCWGQYRHLVDLGVILNGLQADEYLAWKALLKKHQLVQTFYVGLYLLEQLFDYKVMDADYHAKKQKKIGTQLIKSLQNNSLVGKWSDNPRKLIYHLKMRDTLYQQLMTGKNLLLFKLTF